MSDSQASPTSTTSTFPATMPPINRSRGRNVHIYDVNKRDVVLGGLILFGGVTNANLYFMVEIFIIFMGPFFIQDETGTRIRENDCPLLPGNYYVVATGKFYCFSFSSSNSLSN
jgi:hypothetical protein